MPARTDDQCPACRRRAAWDMGKQQDLTGHTAQVVVCVRCGYTQAAGDR